VNMPLPAGFILEPKERKRGGGLPEGFTLEPPVAAEPEVPTWWETVKRPAISGLRAVNVGLARGIEDIWRLHRKPGVLLGEALGIEDIEQKDPVLKMMNYKPGQIYQKDLEGFLCIIPNES